MGLNLLKYFIHDRRDLSSAYVRNCEKFFHNLKLKKNKKIKKKVSAQARKLDKSSSIGYYRINKGE
jgi:hypothetical protein